MLRVSALFLPAHALHTDEYQLATTEATLRPPLILFPLRRELSPPLKEVYLLIYIFLEQL